MNEKNKSGEFDYQQSLNRISKINDDDFEGFSISNQAHQSPQSFQGVQQSQTPTSSIKREFEQVPTSNYTKNEDFSHIPTYQPKTTQSKQENINAQQSTAKNTNTNVQPKREVNRQKPQQTRKPNQQKPQATRKPNQQKPQQKKPQPKNSKTINIKLILIAVAVILAILIVMVGILGGSKDNEKPTNSTEVTAVSQDELTETTEETTKKQTKNYSYETLLVNFENPLPDDYHVELVDYQDLDGKWWTVAEDIVDPLDTLINAAKNQGVELIINSAYRSNESQNKLFVTSIEDYEDEGYSYDEALEKTGEYVAKPGTSEHETGISVDFGYTGDTTWTECYSWLEKNSYKYGFIVRYPSGKSDITKITYETWHYRYVGVDIATKMFEQDLCLEEYLSGNGGG